MRPCWASGGEGGCWARIKTIFWARPLFVLLSLSLAVFGGSDGAIYACSYLEDVALLCDPLKRSIFLGPGGSWFRGIAEAHPLDNLQQLQVSPQK